MRRVENIALTVIAILVGFSVLAYNIAGALFPEAIDVPQESTIENRYYQVLPELSQEDFFEKKYQGELDRYLSDHVPARDAVMLSNAALQRTSIAASAAVHGYEVFPTFFGSRYYVVPRDSLIVDRAEELPSPSTMRALDAWVNTLNEAAHNHSDMRFVYDCVARHDQTEANPTYQYYDHRLNPAWVETNLVQRLDPSIDAFIDSVESYDEILEEWFCADPHWTLKRALKSYNMVASRMGLSSYSYENPVVVVDSWNGSYAKSGLDLDISCVLEDLPEDFSQLSFYDLQEDGGAEKTMGLRDAVLYQGATVEADGTSKYYEYYGGGSAEVHNSGQNNGRTALFIGDSLSYCLSRFIAANYRETVFLLPGNGRYSHSLEDYLQLYNPDDVIVMMHASKYEMIAEYSPSFIGLE